MCPSGSAFAIPLGPTNPSLIIIAKETLVFRRRGFSPRLRLLVPTFSLPYAPAWVTPLPSQQNGMLSYRVVALRYAPCTSPTSQTTRGRTRTKTDLIPDSFCVSRRKVRVSPRVARNEV